MKKILFFDDEPYISRYLIACLNQISKDNNYEWDIKFISTIEDLLKVLPPNKFILLLKEINNVTVTYDLYIFDVMVPLPSGEVENLFTKDDLNKMNNGMSTGLVMVDKIRKKQKKVPILYLSARLIPPIPQSEKSYTAYIRKPESPDNIAKKINELLNKIIKL